MKNVLPLYLVFPFAISLAFFPRFVETQSGGSYSADLSGDVAHFSILSSEKDSLPLGWRDNWSLEVFATRRDGSIVERPFVELSSVLSESAPGSSFFYFSVPADTQALQFTTRWQQDNVFDTSLVFSVHSDEIFCLSVSSDFHIQDGKNTCWEKTAFTATQLADLVIKKIDVSDSTNPMGFKSFPTIEKSIVNNMSSDEKETSKWDSIKWEDSQVSGTTSLSERYSLIRSRYLSFNPLYYSQISKTNFIPLIVSCFCGIGVMVSVFFLVRRDKNDQR